MATRAHGLVLAAGLAFLGAGILNASTSSPLTFEANQGQAAPQVKFLARGDGYGIFLTPSEAVLVLRKPEAGSRVLHLRWMGARQAPRVSGQEEQRAKINYLKGGNPAGWHRNVPAYARVAYESVYPGIDLVFYGNQRQLEHDYILAPGSDPRKIRFAFEGADRMEIDSSGELAVHFGPDEVRLHRPVAYQVRKTGNVSVPVEYRLIARRGARLPEVGFALGTYDREAELVIDPAIVYSSYLGGYRFDSAAAVAVDAAENAYFTGTTYSFRGDFPITPGAFQTGGHPEGDPCLLFSDAFITKVDPSGAIVYSTYLGGESFDEPSGIAVDAQGNAYVSGWTSSQDFPLVHPVGYGGGVGDTFVAKLDPSGSSLVFSTLLGGRDREGSAGIALDSEGSIYVAGATQSPDFPTHNAVQPNLKGGSDVFLTKLPSDGSRIVYSTFLGGQSGDDCYGLAVDSAGYAVVAGITWSADFPAVRALQTVRKGTTDGFVARIHPSGAPLIFSTYLGGSDYDAVSSVAVKDDIYIAGSTSSADFPLTSNPIQGVLREIDGFVTQLTAQGELRYSTLLGGSSEDRLAGIAVHPWGYVTVAGSSWSTDYPVRGAFQSECAPGEGLACSGDAVVTTLSTLASQIVFSTYLGGTRWDFSEGIALGEWENFFIAGQTFSSDFPTRHAVQPEYGGSMKDPDAFIAKLTFNLPPDCAAAVADPSTLWPPNGKLTQVSIRGVTDPEGHPFFLGITSIDQDEPLSHPGEPDALGLSAPGTRIRADRMGKGDGRVYTINFSAVDDGGARCTGTVKVCVPHDQRPGATCGDGGALFDSTASAKE